jgi:CBS domain-containing protein
MVMREYSKVVNDDKADSIELSEFMIKNPITIHPEASIMEAMNIMLEHKIGCLPVVKNSRLVGIITEHNFMDITRRLLYALAGEKEHN